MKLKPCLLLLGVWLMQIAAYRQDIQRGISYPSRRVVPLYSEEPKLNLLNEEIKELKEGIDQFQSNTFQQLYNKKVSWDKSNDDDQEISESSTTWKESPEAQSGSNSTEPASTKEDQSKSSSVPPVAEGSIASPVITVKANDVNTTDKIQTIATSTAVLAAEKKELAAPKTIPPVQSSTPTSPSLKDPAAVITELLLKTQNIPEEIKRNTLSPDILAKQKEKEEEDKIYKAQSAVSTNFIEIMKELNKEAKEKEFKDFQRRTTTTSVEPAIISTSNDKEQKKRDLKELTNYLKVDQLINKKDEQNDYSTVTKKAEKIIQQESRPVVQKVAEVKTSSPPPKVEERSESPEPRAKPFQIEPKTPQKPKKWFEKVLGFLESDANIIVPAEPEKPLRIQDNPPKAVVQEVVEVPKPAPKPIVVERPIAGKIVGKEEKSVTSVPQLVLQKEQAIEPPPKKNIVGRLFSFLESDPNINVASSTPPTMPKIVPPPQTKPVPVVVSRPDEPRAKDVSTPKKGGFNVFGLFGKKEQPEEKIALKPTVSKPQSTSSTSDTEYRPVIKVGVKRSTLTGVTTQLTPVTSPKPSITSPVITKPVVIAPAPVPPSKPVTVVVEEKKKVTPVQEEVKKPAKGILGWFGVKEDDENERLTISTPDKAIQTEVLSRIPSEPRPVAQKRREEPTKKDEKVETEKRQGGLFGLFGSNSVPSPPVSTAVTSVKKVEASLRPVVKPPPSKPVPVQIPPKVPPVKPMTAVARPVVSVPMKTTPAQPPRPVATPAVIKPVNTIAPVKPVSNTPVKKSGGLFGLFGGGAEKEKEQKPVTTTTPTPVKTITSTNTVPQKTKGPSAMNINFQRMITKTLNNDANKINSFQKLTDNYRSGNLDARQFIISIERLFTTTSSLETIILPLINELPEKDVAERLKNVYEKYRKEKKVESGSSNSGGEKSKGGFFGLFGGKKVETKEVTKVVTSPPPTTTTTVTKTVTTSQKPTTTSSSSTVSTISIINGLKVPDRVPISKKSIIAKQLQLVNESKIKAKELFDYLVREIGETKVKNINNDISMILNKDKFIEYDKLVKTLK